MLWYAHGKKPSGASYQYIVVPNVTEQELNQSSANNRSVEILANTSAVQAVRHSQLGMTQLAFYTSGSVEIEKGLTVQLDSPGMAMLKTQGGRLSELTVADPSRKLNRISLTLSGVYNTQGENFRTLVDEKQKSTLFIVDLPQGVYAGKSVGLKVK